MVGANLNERLYLHWMRTTAAAKGTKTVGKVLLVSVAVIHVQRSTEMTRQ